ncbi:MAG: ATP-binding protein [Chloroflexi bacterium]|nr:ATP-binding protein [Chloroflexota bacterium]MCI0575950.1 ATP-binding protein [Chloroflexota bacterium]MCI0648137.1 ATP-binding protein [Chloroflexota bacterium]MCI0729587.1 ATP-binding protein [Chloroflexota bacterium]
MNANGVANWLIEGIFLLLSGLTLANLLRHRGRSRLDIAAMFGVLAVAALAQALAPFTPLTGWLLRLAAISLSAQPFLLLRLVGHFRRVSGKRYWAALGGMLLTWTILVFFSTPPLWAILCATTYFVATEVYAALVFVQQARTTAGVTGRRLRLVALGSALLAVATLIFVTGLVFPVVAPVFSSLALVVTTLTGLSYYLGFAPPRWLSNYWRLAELQTFLQESAGVQIGQQADKTLEQLCLAAGRSVGSQANLVALWNNESGRLELHTPEKYPSLPAALAGDGVIGRAWQEQRPWLAQKPAGLGTDGARLVAETGSQTLLVVPIATPDRAWGVLIALASSSPLFAEDDLALLALLCQQSAILLNQAAALEQTRQHAAELEQHVAARTADLQARNEELDAFAHTVAHDLKTPVGNLVGFATLLKLDYPRLSDEERMELIENVVASGQKTQHIIDALLMLASAHHGQVPLQRVNMENVVHEARQRLQPMMETRQVRVIEPESWPPALGLEPWVEEVWANYLSNAIKYGGQPPCIRLGATDLANGKVRFWVLDNGPGLTAEEQSFLFMPFSRTSQPRTNGHGLGLSIVRRIVSHLGGEVGVESRPGQGSMFWFTLPKA